MGNPITFISQEVAYYPEGREITRIICSVYTLDWGNLKKYLQREVGDMHRL